MKKIILTVKDVQTLMGVGRTKAYSMIAETNKQLEEKGMHYIRGKVSKKLFYERWGLE